MTLPPTRGSLSATSSSRSSSTLQSGSTFQPSSAVPSPGSASSASGGSLVGIIVGVVIAVIVVVAALGYLAWRRLRRGKINSHRHELVKVSSHDCEQIETSRAEPAPSEYLFAPLLI